MNMLDLPTSLTQWTRECLLPICRYTLHRSPQQCSMHVQVSPLRGGHAVVGRRRPVLTIHAVNFAASGRGGFTFCSWSCSLDCLHVAAGAM